MSILSREQAKVLAAALEAAAKRGLDDAAKNLPQMLRDSAGIVQVVTKMADSSRSRHLHLMAKEVRGAILEGQRRLYRLNDLMQAQHPMDDLAPREEELERPDAAERLRRVAEHVARSNVAWDWAALQYGIYINRFDFIQKTYLGRLREQRFKEAMGIGRTLLGDIAMAPFPFASTWEATLKTARDKIDRLAEDLQATKKPLERAELLLQAMEELQELGRLTEEAIVEALAMDGAFRAA